VEKVSQYNEVKSLVVNDESLSRIWLVGSYTRDPNDPNSGPRPLDDSVTVSLRTKDRINLPREADDLGLTELEIVEIREERIERPGSRQTDEKDVMRIGEIRQKYESRTPVVIDNNIGSAGLIFVELKPVGKKVDYWVAAASELLLVGKESIATEVWKKFGENFKPSESAVVTFLHLLQDQSPHEAGVVALAEMLCAGLPGDATYDQPLGPGVDGVPPGVVRRSDNWYYYASKRRIGCVLANTNESSPFRRGTFPQGFREEMIGVLGFGLLESHFLSLYLKKLSTDDNMGEAAEAVRKLRQLNRASLLLQVALGNGQVSNRHGVQLWYDTIATGLQLEQRLSNLFKVVASLTEVHQAELQAQETIDQGRLLKLGTFFAGALGYATVIEALNSYEGVEVPDLMKLWLDISPLNLVVPMLVVGVLAVAGQQIYQWLAARIGRSLKSKKAGVS
jgi:hypothetical protein